MNNCMKFYNLMYIDLYEKRTLNGRSYTEEKRIDLYVKNSCILDKSLKLSKRPNLGPHRILTFG